MSSVRLRYHTVEFGELDIHLRTLRDVQEHDEDDATATDAGVPTAQWAVPGVMWPAGYALAQVMLNHDIEDLRILEVGCGIGLTSLVLNQRAADITATDQHPNAGTFLAENVALNGGEPIPFVRTSWEDLDSGMGLFDLIVGSDVLYESEHPEALSGFIDRHAQPACEVIIMDSGRGGRGKFSKRMVTLGFAHSQEKADQGDSPTGPYSGQVLRFVRAA